MKIVFVPLVRKSPRTQFEGLPGPVVTRVQGSLRQTTQELTWGKDTNTQSIKPWNNSPLENDLKLYPEIEPRTSINKQFSL